MRSATLFTLLSIATGALAAFHPRRSSTATCYACPEIGANEPAPYAANNGDLGCSYADFEGTSATVICTYNPTTGTQTGGNSEECYEEAGPTNYLCASASIYGDLKAEFIDPFYEELGCDYGSAYCLYNQNNGDQSGQNHNCPSPVPCSGTAVTRRTRKRAGNHGVVKGKAAL